LAVAIKIKDQALTNNNDKINSFNSAFNLLPTTPKAQTSLNSLSFLPKDENNPKNTLGIKSKRSLVNQFNSQTFRSTVKIFHIDREISSDSKFVDFDIFKGKSMDITVDEVLEKIKYSPNGKYLGFAIIDTDYVTGIIICEMSNKI